MQLGYEVEVQNAGQCDVSIRHDGRIFATGGWDNRQVNEITFMCWLYCEIAATLFICVALLNLQYLLKHK